MLHSVKQDLIDDATAQQSNKLAGIKSIRLGDINMPTQDQPGITIDWDGHFASLWTGSHVELTGTFAVTLYASALSIADADLILENNLLRWEGGKWKGVLAWLIGLQGYKDDNGRSWTVTVQPDIKRGTIQSKVSSVAAVIPVDVTTWADKTEFT